VPRRKNPAFQGATPSLETAANHTDRIPNLLKDSTFAIRAGDLQLAAKGRITYYSRPFHSPAEWLRKSGN
jgi:hypothetical protein